MKKLLSYSLILVATATVGMTECVVRISPTQKRAAQEDAKVLRELHAAEMQVVTAMETGASEDIVEKKQSYLAEKVEAAKKYLNRKKQSFDEMSLTKKLILGAVSTATVVVAVDYSMWGDKGYMAKLGNAIYNNMPESVKTAISNATTYVSDNVYGPAMERAKRAKEYAGSWVPGFLKGTEKTDEQ